MSGVFDSRGSRLYRPVLFYNVSFPWHKNHEKGDKENCGRCRFPADHGQKQTVETAGSRKPEVHPVGNGGGGGVECCSLAAVPVSIWPYTQIWRLPLAFRLPCTAVSIFIYIDSEIWCNILAYSALHVPIHNLMHWSAHNERDWHKCTLNACGNWFRIGLV